MVGRGVVLGFVVQLPQEVADFLVEGFLSMGLFGRLVLGAWLWLLGEVFRLGELFECGEHAFDKATDEDDEKENRKWLSEEKVQDGVLERFIHDQALARSLLANVDAGWSKSVACLRRRS